MDFFDWAEDVEIGNLVDIEPVHVAASAETPHLPRFNSFRPVRAQPIRCASPPD